MNREDFIFATVGCMAAVRMERSIAHGRKPDLDFVPASVRAAGDAYDAIQYELYGEPFDPDAPIPYNPVTLEDFAKVAAVTDPLCAAAMAETSPIAKALGALVPSSTPVPPGEQKRRGRKKT